MSGLRHSLGETIIRAEQGDDHTPVSYPRVGGKDREAAALAIWVAGFARGSFDGMAAARASGYPKAAPISAGHVLLHMKACVKAQATELAGSGLSAKSLEKEWLAGYKEAVAQAFSLRGQAFYQSPGGDPDQGE